MVASGLSPFGSARPFIDRIETPRYSRSTSQSLNHEHRFIRNPMGRVLGGCSCRRRISTPNLMR